MPRPPPHPSSASGECRPTFETRPGLTTAPGLLYPPTGHYLRRALPAPSSCPLRPGDSGSLPGPPPRKPRLFFLGPEPALHRGVVVAVAPAAHTAGDAAGLEHGLVVLARVGAALIRMMQQPGGRTPTPQRHLEGSEREVAVVRRAECPSDAEAREQVHDGSQVEWPAGDQQLRVAFIPMLSCAYSGKQQSPPAAGQYAAVTLRSTRRDAGPWKPRDHSRNRLRDRSFGPRNGS